MENGLVSFFPDTPRVHEAWRRMRRGDDLDRPLGESSHALMRQECNSYLEGLEPVVCFHHPAAEGSDLGCSEALGDWVTSLEEAWPSIHKELKAVIGDKEKLEQGSNVWVGPLAGEKVGQAYGAGWKTFGLCDREEWDEANIALFPKTTK